MDEADGGAGGQPSHDGQARRPAFLHDEHRDDRRAQPGHSSDGQVDLADQQDQDDADGDRTDGHDLKHQVGQVHRGQEAWVEHAHDDPDDHQPEW